MGEGSPPGGGQGGGQRRSPEGVDGAGQGPFRADADGQADQQLDQVGLAGRLGGDGPGVVEVDQPGPSVVVHDHALAAQVAVGDAGLVQGGHLPPGGGQGVVTDVGRAGLLQRAARDHPLHQQPRPVAVLAGQHHPRGPDPGRAGEQAEVGLALDLLEGRAGASPARLGPAPEQRRQTR